jgi:hypothetical protein
MESITDYNLSLRLWFDILDARESYRKHMDEPQPETQQAVPPTPSVAEPAVPPAPRPSQPLPPHPAFSSAVTLRRTPVQIWAVLFVLVIAVCVGTTYIWQQQKIKTLQTQKLAADTAVEKISDQLVILQKATDADTTATNLLKLPELSIQITLPAALSDMTYAVTSTSPVGSHANTTVGLSTLGLITLDSQCDASKSPLGWLSKTAGIYPTKTTEENSSGTLVKQYSTYYISYKAPQAQCSDLKAVQAKETSDIDALPTWSTVIQTIP